VLDVDIDDEGNIYVLHYTTFSESPAVIVLDKDFSFLGEFGVYGADNGQFLEPVSISVDSSGLIYVADSSRSQIQYFSMSDIDRSTSSSALPIRSSLDRGFLIRPEQKIE
jgi:DNA-binding beta-propeller fold protein YncE